MRDCERRAWEALSHVASRSSYRPPPTQKQMGPATCWQQVTGYPTRSVEAPGFRNLRRGIGRKGFELTNP